MIHGLHQTIKTKIQFSKADISSKTPQKLDPKIWRKGNDLRWNLQVAFSGASGVIVAPTCIAVMLASSFVLYYSLFLFHSFFLHIYVALVLRDIRTWLCQTHKWTTKWVLQYTHNFDNDPFHIYCLSFLFYLYNPL